jgi:hypothetical protein
MSDFDLAKAAGLRSSLPFTERTAPMVYQQSNAAFPGLSDGGTQRQSPGQPTAAPGTGSGQFSWSGVVPPQLEEIARRGNGLVLALWGGIAVAGGALLPFVCNVQETVDGTSFATGSAISAGYRFISLLFGLLLAGLALWTRYRPAFRRRIAIAALVASLLGLAGYFLFTLIGLAGITAQASYGTAQLSWDPSIGALLSIGGCAACATAAIVMLRTRPPALSQPR